MSSNNNAHERLIQLGPERLTDMLTELAARSDEAADMVKRVTAGHADEFAGDYYTGLLGLAEAMEKKGRWLVTSLIYRALLDSILAQAVSKYYHHGIRYLKKLDSLDASIRDWRSFQDHESYKAGLLQAHGRKTSFWSRYVGE